MLALLMAVALAAANIVWAPQPGSQVLFMACPFEEALIAGTKGGGKTDVLLMDFAQHCGRGHGAAWRGILFRRTFPELDDVITKSRRWFPKIFPGAEYNDSKHTWTWPGGEQLLLRHMRELRDYWSYHGQEFTWIGFEELGTWPNLECYDAMKSCLRSSVPGVPKKIRATANPFGVGHNAIKRRFVDPAPAGTPIPNKTGGHRVHIASHWSENKALLAADPDYPKRLAADRNKNRRKAWLWGAWDVVSGGMFDDLWDRQVHTIKGWPIAATPASWRIDRALDWGSAKPFSVGWWLESDGTPAPDGIHYPPRTLFRAAEWYGWDGENANEGARLTDAAVADGIVEREIAMGLRTSKDDLGRVKPGPADSSIFVKEPGKRSIADVFAEKRCSFTEAPKKPGSRKAGCESLRRMLAEVVKWAESSAKSQTAIVREQPGLLVFENCNDGFLRTVPVLPRDENDPEDVDTAAEDHAYDETRYRLTAVKRTATTGGSFRV